MFDKKKLISSVPDWENLDVFFDLLDFGTVAEHNNKKLIGIFDLPFIDVDIGTGYTYENRKATFLCKEKDAINIFKNDILIINKIEYQILDDPDEDGTGVTTINLAPL